MRPAMAALEHRIPPPVVAFAAAALMWLAARVTPLSAPRPDWLLLPALLVFIVGMAVCAAGLRAFERAKTTSNPMHPDRASALVTGGVYRFTRNPMYLGWLLALAAWAIWLASLLPVVVLPLFFAYVQRFQIAPEERVLLALFGEPYAAYCRRVRRWL